MSHRHKTTTDFTNRVIFFEPQYFSTSRIRKKECMQHIHLPSKISCKIAQFSPSVYCCLKIRSLMWRRKRNCLFICTICYSIFKSKAALLCVQLYAVKQRPIVIQTNRVRKMFSLAAHCSLYPLPMTPVGRGTYFLAYLLLSPCIDSYVYHLVFM